MKYHTIVSALFLGVFCFLIGCGGGGTNLSGLAPCSGTVMLKGTPVEGASIVFIPKSGQRAAAATTDAQGRFTVTTLNPQDGIAPGEYVVTVSKKEFYGPELPPQKDEFGEMYNPQRPQKNTLPDQYASAERTPLTVTIPSGGNKNLEINLDE